MIKVTTIKEWTKHEEKTRRKIAAMRRLQKDRRCSLDTFYRLQYEIEELRIEIGA